MQSASIPTANDTIARVFGNTVVAASRESGTREPGRTSRESSGISERANEGDDVALVLRREMQRRGIKRLIR